MAKRITKREFVYNLLVKLNEDYPNGWHKGDSIKLMMDNPNYFPSEYQANHYLTRNCDHALVSHQGDGRFIFYKDLFE